jgi:hypothetical protein
MLTVSPPDASVRCPLISKIKTVKETGVVGLLRNEAVAAEHSLMQRTNAQHSGNVINN